MCRCSCYVGAAVRIHAFGESEFSRNQVVFELWSGISSILIETARIHAADAFDVVCARHPAVCTRRYAASAAIMTYQ